MLYGKYSELTEIKVIIAASSFFLIFFTTTPSSKITTQIALLPISERLLIAFPITHSLGSKTGIILSPST